MMSSGALIFFPPLFVRGTHTTERRAYKHVQATQTGVGAELAQFNVLSRGVGRSRMKAGWKKRMRVERMENG